ncbi:MAG: DUF4430 domain-containing protein [Phycisphaerae bacterium]
MHTAHTTLALLTLCMGSAAPTVSQGSSDEQKQSVRFELVVTDKDSGLDVKAIRSFPAGTNAFDAIHQMVGLAFSTHPKFGALITSVCGVEATNGKQWTLYVNDKFSQVGISSVSLDGNTKVRWQTEDWSKH